jgi:hypothetical protein
MTTTRRSAWGWIVVATLAGCGGAGDGLGSEAQAVDAAPLAARPASAEFGAMAIGSTATKRVTLTNTGTQVVDIVDVSVSSAFPPDPCRAVVIQPCIRPGESTTLEVSCAPTAPGSLQGRVALSYRSGADAQALTVPISGEGVSPRR